MGGYARQEDRREKEEMDEDAEALDRLPPVYPRKRDETGWKLSDPLFAVGISRVRDGFADFDFALCVAIQRNIPYIYSFNFEIIRPLKFVKIFSIFKLTFNQLFSFAILAKEQECFVSIIYWI